MIRNNNVIVMLNETLLLVVVHSVIIEMKCRKEVPSFLFPQVVHTYTRRYIPYLLPLLSLLSEDDIPIH